MSPSLRSLAIKTEYINFLRFLRLLKAPRNNSDCANRPSKGRPNDRDFEINLQMDDCLGLNHAAEAYFRLGTY